MLEWLTDTEKQEKLLCLRQEIEDKDLDLSFIPYLNRLNDIPDVCTTQCCTGHNKKPGYLSLRFSFHMEAYFKYHAIQDILELPEVQMVEENYEIFSGLLRQRTVIWFGHENWKETVEKIIKITESAHELMRSKVDAEPT